LHACEVTNDRNVVCGKGDTVGQNVKVRVATVNVGTLVGRRSKEVVEMLARIRVDVSCVQEVQYKGEGCRVIGGGLTFAP